jgi:pimeloyl-ACP methyl ester carboxylesterase
MIAAATVLRLVGGVLVAAVIGAAVFNVVAHLDARRGRGRSPAPAEGFARSPWTVQLRIVALETAALALFFVSAPLRPGRPRLASAPARAPVLLLPGYGLPSASMRLLARRLRRDGWTSVHVIPYRTVFGSLERSVAVLGAAVERIRREVGATRVDVVAHSLGGLVARAYVRARGVRAGIGRLVTLGTPHGGTESFRWLRLDPMLAEVRPESAPLRRLGTADPVPGLTRVVSFYTTDDDIIVPPWSADYPGATNVPLRGVGHLGLLLSRDVYELVRRDLAWEPGTGHTTDREEAGHGADRPRA